MDQDEPVPAEAVEAIPAPDNAIPDTHAELSPVSRERSSKKKSSKKPKKKLSFEGVEAGGDDDDDNESLRSGRSMQSMQSMQSMHSMHSMRSTHSMRSARSAANLYPPGMYPGHGPPFVPYQNPAPAPYNFPVPPAPSRDWDEMSNHSDTRSVGSRMSMRSATSTASSRRHQPYPGGPMGHPNGYHRAQSVPMMPNQVFNVQPPVMVLGGSNVMMPGMPSYADPHGLSRHHSAPPTYNLGGDPAAMSLASPSNDSIHSHRSAHGGPNPVLAPGGYVPPPSPRGSLYGSSSSVTGTSSIQSVNRSSNPPVGSSSSVSSSSAAPVRGAAVEEDAAIERAILNSIQDEEQRRKNLEADRVAVQKGLQRSLTERAAANPQPSSSSSSSVNSHSHSQPPAPMSRNPSQRGPPAPQPYPQSHRGGPVPHNGPPPGHSTGPQYPQQGPPSHQGQQRGPPPSHHSNSGPPPQSHGHSQPQYVNRGPPPPQQSSRGPAPPIQHQQQPLSQYPPPLSRNVSSGPSPNHYVQSRPSQGAPQAHPYPHGGHGQGHGQRPPQQFNKPPPAVPAEEPTLSYTSIYDT